MLEQRGIVGMDLELQKPKIINKKLADTLKLDLRKVNNLNLNGNGIVKNEEIVGFHQEFMSKINEFSESWRNAALNEH